MKRILLPLLLLLLVSMVSHAATKEENLRTCLSGKYPSLCNYSVLTPEQRKQANEAVRRENLKTCMTGKYTSLCNRSLLSQEERRAVAEAERRENLTTCMSGKYKSLCKYGLLSKEEFARVKEAERQENLRTCLNGNYPSLCNRALLSPTQKGQAAEAEKRAAARAEKIKRAKPSAPVGRSANGYLIEVAHNDELFIINGEKYEAQIYCLGWEEGEEVLFIEGSPYGACASAKLYNLNRRESCDVWCE